MLKLSQLQFTLLKVKSLLFWVAFSFSILGLSLVLYYKYDRQLEELPAFCIAIPVSVVLLSITAYQLWEFIYQNDMKKKILYSLESKYKIFINVCSCCISVCYVISLMISMFLIQQRSKFQNGKILPVLKSIMFRHQRFAAVHPYHDSDLRDLSDGGCGNSGSRHHFRVVKL